MSFILTVMRLCRGASQSDTDNARPAVQTVNDNDAASLQDIDLEAGRRQQGQTLFDFAAWPQQDEFQFLCRRFVRGTNYCLLDKVNEIARIEKALGDIKDKDDQRRTQLKRDLCDNLTAHHQLALAAVELNKLRDPNSRLLSDYLTYAEELLKDESKDDKAFICREVHEWAELYHKEPLERMAKLAPNHPFWKGLVRPKRTIKSSDNVTKEEYSDNMFQVLILTFFHLVIAGLAGVPVILQALNVTSTPVNVAIYMISLLLGITFAQILIGSHSTQFLMTLAVAAVVNTNLIRGQ